MGFDDLLTTLTSFVASPWAIPVVFLLATLDAFLPVVPSETVVVAGSALAFGGAGPDLFLLWAVAAAGAFVGDRISYRIGAGPGRRLLSHAASGRDTRRARLLRSAEGQLRERGDTLIVSARFIPGGRTTITLACGATGFPSRRFTVLTALSGALWSGYCVLLGYLGTVLGSDVTSGALWGCVLAVASAGAAELVRARLRRRGPRTPAPAFLPGGDRGAVPAPSAGRGRDQP